MIKPDSKELPQRRWARAWSECPALRFGRAAIAAFALVLGSAAIHAQPSVLQRGYNPSVTGANLDETILNTSNVAPATFGLLFTVPTANIYAQPLYVPGVAIPNHGTHNVVYVATMADTLMAFGADTAASKLMTGRT